MLYNIFKIIFNSVDLIKVHYFLSSHSRMYYNVWMLQQSIIFYGMGAKVSQNVLYVKI